MAFLHRIDGRGRDDGRMSAKGVFASCRGNLPEHGSGMLPSGDASEREDGGDQTTAFRLFNIRGQLWLGAAQRPRAIGVVAEVERVDRRKDVLLMSRE